MIRSKRGPVEDCPSCGRTLREEQKICACGAATRFMTFEERASYEVEQWRAHRRRLDDAQAC